MMKRIPNGSEDGRDAGAEVVVAGAAEMRRTVRVIAGRRCVEMLARVRKNLDKKSATRMRMHSAMIC